MTEYTGRVSVNVVENDGEFLVAFDEEDECWEFHGGKEEVQEGEPEGIRETAYRESEEEFGFTRDELNVLKVGESFPSKRDDSWTLVPLHMKASNREIEFTGNEEHIEYSWIKLADLEDYQGPGMRRALEHLDLL